MHYILIVDISHVDVQWEQQNLLAAKTSIAQHNVLQPSYIFKMFLNQLQLILDASPLKYTVFDY